MNYDGTPGCERFSFVSPSRFLIDRVAVYLYAPLCKISFREALFFLADGV
ncbi:MAG: hypothetical protein LBB82_05840 [Treponema sp.]|jgi:hypothetical protein|nr:hypothetical protein [Treponema sp.]